MSGRTLTFAELPLGTRFMFRDEGAWWRKSGEREAEGAGCFRVNVPPDRVIVATAHEPGERLPLAVLDPFAAENAAYSHRQCRACKAEFPLSVEDGCPACGSLERAVRVFARRSLRLDSDGAAE